MTPKGTAFGLRARLRIVHPLRRGEEHDCPSRNQNSPPQEGLHVPTGPPSRLGNGWDERSRHCDDWRCDHEIAEGASNRGATVGTRAHWYGQSARGATEAT